MFFPTTILFVWLSNSRKVSEPKEKKKERKKERRKKEKRKTNYDNNNLPKGSACTSLG